jgi:hypothetical protein
MTTTSISKRRRPASLAKHRHMFEFYRRVPLEWRFGRSELISQVLINMVQLGCNRFPINVVSFSHNVVLRNPLFSINSVSKPRMLSVRAVYVLSSLQIDRHRVRARRPQILHADRQARSALQAFSGNQIEFSHAPPNQIFVCVLLTPPTISRRNLLKWGDDGTRRS